MGKMIKGVGYSLFASLLFSLLYYWAVLLRPLSGESLFGFRMWVMFPFIIMAIFLLKQKQQFVAFLMQIKSEPKLLIILLFTASLVGSQMWLFLWAPNHNKAIDVSIGYLLMPIVMVIVGHSFFKESLSILKILSIVSASIGVMGNLISVGKISWCIAMVCVGYPIYFSLRKFYRINHIASFTCEIILLLPIALYFICKTDIDAVLSVNPNLYLLLALLGLISGVALISYTLASSLVPMNALGLLGYVEPMAMLFVAFFIGEKLDEQAYFLMLCLGIAIFLLLLEGGLALRKQLKVRRK